MRRRRFDDYAMQKYGTMIRPKGLYHGKKTAEVVETFMRYAVSATELRACAVSSARVAPADSDIVGRAWWSGVRVYEAMQSGGDEG